MIPTPRPASARPRSVAWRKYCGEGHAACFPATSDCAPGSQSMIGCVHLTLIGGIPDYCDLCCCLIICRWYSSCPVWRPSRQSATWCMRQAWAWRRSACCLTLLCQCLPRARSWRQQCLLAAPCRWDIHTPSALRLLLFAGAATDIAGGPAGAVTRCRLTLRRRHARRHATGACCPLHLLLLSLSAGYRGSLYVQLLPVCCFPS